MRSWQLLSVGHREGSASRSTMRACSVLTNRAKRFNFQQKCFGDGCRRLLTFRGGTSSDHVPATNKTNLTCKTLIRVYEHQ